MSQPAKEEKSVRRYEMVDTETGEKVPGVNFALSPADTVMYRLLDPEPLGGRYELGMYYWAKKGEIEGEAENSNLLDIYRYFLASEVLLVLSAKRLAWLQKEIDSLLKTGRRRGVVAPIDDSEGFSNKGDSTH